MCIVRKGGFTREGMGSYFHHVKSSIILADYLGANLFLDDEIPETKFHGYRVSEAVGLPSTKSEACDTENKTTCKLNHDMLMNLIPSICHKIVGREDVMSVLGLEGCQVVEHTVSREFLPGHSDCVGDWYQRHLFHGVVRHMSRDLEDATGTQQCVRIGVHIRWGDSASRAKLNSIGNSTHLPYSGIQLTEIQKALRNIHLIDCACSTTYVYIKDVPENEDLGFKHTVIDTGNDTMDLLHYMENDILIQGWSSYPILGVFAAQNKIVITDKKDHAKYQQNFKVVSKLFDTNEQVYFSCRGSPYEKKIEELLE